jgi:TonB-dependent SusC/RagA subfamily outer membrane receptor
VFHRQKQDTNAYVNLEIERLKFVDNHSDQSNDTELLKLALTNLKKIYKNHPASALVDYEIAAIYASEGLKYSSKDTTNQWKRKTAILICDEVISRFPKSNGAYKLRALKGQILTQVVSLQAEEFVPASTPSRILVSYKNIPHLYFRVYKVSKGYLEDFLIEQNDSLKLAMLNGLTPGALLQANLPNPGDYQNHSTELILPAFLNGTYLIVASEEQQIDHRKIFGYTSIRSTDLALLYIAGNNNRFQLVNRVNGKPIAGADVHLTSVANYNSVRMDQHYTTDRHGFVVLGKTGEDASWNLEANVRYNGDTVLFRYYDYYNRQRGHYDDDDDEEEGFTARAFLFTDRSIYRPGQTVFFKGIFIKTKNKKSSLVINETLEVFLQNPNGKDVTSMVLKTNAFGSFSGEFKLPASGITGDYSLYVDEPTNSDSKFFEDLDDYDYDEVEFSVEEYKRPTFEVAIKPATGTFKLNDTIRVTGNATAYSGSKISKAKVSYTVKREVSYPRWYYWSYANRNSGATDVDYGEVDSDEKGEFIIPFKAIPDEKISPESKPVFTYSVSVEVTDINGETRTAESTVRVGYHSMIATVGVPSTIDLQSPLATVAVTTENLNGQSLPAAGTVKIYKLRAPARPMRARPWEAPDQPTISREEFEKIFPNDPYDDDVSKPVTWPKAKLAKDLVFDTKKSKEVNFTIDKTWEIGSYVVELYTTDSLGRVVEDKATFEIFNSRNTRVADNSLLVFQTDKTSYKSNELVRLKVGSAFPEAVLTIDIEKNGEVVKTYAEQLSGNIKEILIPVDDVTKSGFSIHCSSSMFNKFIEQHKTILIDSDIGKIAIETETFKDKLQPDSKQTWSFTINGQESQRLQAEVLASMYDASLDQFRPHEWTLDFNPEEGYYTNYRVSSGQSFGIADFSISNPSFHPNIPQQNYDAIDWFGFSITNRDYARRYYLQRLYYDPTDPKSIGKPSRVSISNGKNIRAGFISGQVTASDGEVLPGVNIIVRGTTNGTVTDSNGQYSIAAGKNDVLVFSFIGFVTAEVPIGKKNMISVAMEMDIMELSEVVVVGYGVQQKRNLTGSVSVVKTDDSASTGDVVFEEALQGRIAGISIQTAPGTSYNMLIRGQSSLSADAHPLYVVDGVIVESSKIDQEDLVDVQVLKGTAGTAIYGSRGANGVIIITTKNGQKKLDNDLAKVNARKNFNETAFFFPHLTTDENGKIRFSFTTPESLTRWKLQLLAHTKNLLSATKVLQAVTQKEMMVTPNVPRFLRSGDHVIISAKIANLSNRKLDGKVALQLTNPITGQNVDALFANVVRNQTFKTTARGNTQVSWSIKIPENVDVVQYKIVAKAGKFSDGEQNALPVLQNRMLVTETMPMYVRSNQTKTFTLSKLQTQSSPTLTHHRLTLEVTSNPAWYAIQSLPYLMEFPHECAEQLFSRFYANSIASHIVNNNPKIKDVFDKWAASGELISNLEKNQELKSILISETPWVRDAEDETEQKKRIALLFDLALMKSQLASVTDKLEAMQFSDGGFPWFEGSRYPNRYITLHVAASFGHLVKLNIQANEKMRSMMTKAVAFLDNDIVNDHNEVLRNAQDYANRSNNDQKQEMIRQYLDRYVPSNLSIHFLYMRSFYPDLVPNQRTKEAIAFFQKQAMKNWRDYNLYQKGMIALVLYRDNNKQIARDIMASVKENSITTEELGMYWKENKAGWYWHESPIETQALMIESFAEIGATEFPADENVKTVDELRIWLLKNKQTNAWKTTKATTEACYALLLNGTDWLPVDKSVDVTIGKTPVVIGATEAEAGTGYFKKSWKKNAVNADMAVVTLTKKDAGIAWGGLYWQYFEDLDKITPAVTPLKLKKNVFKVVDTDNGQRLDAIGGGLKPGDLIRIRIELIVDRDMEYLHMKDMRAAGFEPVDVLSEYKWREGLGYYQSTRDAATNFFFEQVRKGVYIFEYDLRVNVKGNFSNGITTIQSMYAPEFSSHSEGIRVVVD